MLAKVFSGATGDQKLYIFIKKNSLRMEKKAFRANNKNRIFNCILLIALLSFSVLKTSVVFSQQNQDFKELISHWLRTDSPYDFNLDGKVNSFDFAQLIINILPTPPLTPMPTPTLSPDPCSQSHFKMAFILVAQDDFQLTEERLAKLDSIKANFSTYFYNATQGIASMDTTYDVVGMVGNSSVFPSDPNWVITREVTKQFYQSHPDEFDFISIYTAFSTPRYQSHATVYNNIQGIGKELINDREFWGSTSRLIGVNHMRSINSENPEQPWVYNALMHETGHQWCCFVGGNFARGEGGAQLEIIQQGIHYYRGLDSPYNNTTAMNSDHWVANGDGTYKREMTREVEKYHAFTLYFMGLLPETEFSKEYQIYDAGIPPDFDFESAIPYKTVSINDIIEAEGGRTCQSF